MGSLWEKTFLDTERPKIFTSHAFLLVKPLDGYIPPKGRSKQRRKQTLRKSTWQTGESKSQNNIKLQTSRANHPANNGWEEKVGKLIKESQITRSHYNQPIITRSQQGIYETPDSSNRGINIVYRHMGEYTKEIAEKESTLLWWARLDPFHYRLC